ncbi:MAG: tetratricopeptide repeat protein [Bacteroidales bacterium]|nr:tetratricopeptide repeat protein [Bacteroidales bacterium]
MTNKIINYSVTVFIIITVFASCKLSEQEEKSNNIHIMESQLFEEKKGVIDKKEAANMIHAYLQYVDAYPSDSLSATYLFKAADVSINAFHSDQSIMLFNRVIAEYPNYEKTPQALFLKAFTYENYLLKLDSAKANYELFLEKYPQHPFANDAKISVQNLGKSPEDIIRAFNAE